MGARSCAGFASLPRFLALDVFARLPADARLLLALVSPSWRALVAEPSLWACVDLSVASGVTRASDALLLAVSAKARGGMRSLDVCGRVWGVDEEERPPITFDALLTAVRTNAQSLRHLRALCPPLDRRHWRFLNGRDILDDLLRAARGLTRIEVDIRVAAFDASLLRNGAVSVRRLSVHFPPASLSAFLVDARGCLSLCELELRGRVDAGQVEALLDFVLNKPLTALCLEDITHAAMPSLTRLVSGGRLTTLEVWNVNDVLAPSPAFCAAVAAAPLVRLCYSDGLFDTLTAGLSLLAAVTGHPTLRHLSLGGNQIPPARRTAVGAALGLLVAADSPLIALDISECELGKDCLLPFIDALPRNTHLRRLYCGRNEFTHLTATRLLAAVRATASLVHLRAAGIDPIPALVEAEAVVAARAS